MHGVAPSRDAVRCIALPSPPSGLPARRCPPTPGAPPPHSGAARNKAPQHATHKPRPSFAVCAQQPLSAVLSVDMHPYTVHVFKPFSVLFNNHNWGGPCVLFFRLFEFSLPSLASRVHLPHQTGASPPTLSSLHQHRQPHASPKAQLPPPPLFHRPFYCCAVTRITHRSCAFFTPSAWFTALHCSLASPSRPFKFGCLHACARHSSAVPRTCMSSFSSSFTSSLNQWLHQGTSCSVTIFEAAHTAGPRSLITTLQLSQSSAWA